MQHSTTPAARRATAVAIGAMFFVNGASAASWFPRLPEIRDRLGVSEAGLGLTLVGIGLGGLLASIFSGAFVDRFGSRRMCVTTSVMLSALLPLVALAGRPLVLFPVLILIGAFDGLTDVAMNSQAIDAQRARTRPIVSRFHAMWSVGAVTGGLICAHTAAAGISLTDQLLVTSVVLVVATLVTRVWLIPTSGRRHQTTTVIEGPFGDAGVVESSTEPEAPATFARYKQAFRRLALVGTAVALTEAPPNDWATLMWTDRFHLAGGRAALGYVAIAAGMVVGRFGGDLVTHRFGREATRRGGALLAAIGVVIATTATSAWPMSGVGLFAAGLGISVLFPLMFAAAEEMTPGTTHGMAAFSTGARGGFLVASPLVGVLAGVWSVAVAVLLISATAGLTVAASSLRPAAQRRRAAPARPATR